jgi:hypothetical protein
MKLPPFPAVEPRRPCRVCGFFLGSNRGRCWYCFDAFADSCLERYLDWMTEPAQAEYIDAAAFARAAAEVLKNHGSMLSPG